MYFHDLLNEIGKVMADIKDWIAAHMPRARSKTRSHFQ
jgi:hypothetical protein